MVMLYLCVYYKIWNVNTLHNVVKNTIFLHLIYKFKIEQIKKRWRNLRDSFVKAKKKITAYIPSGSAAPSIQKTKDGFRYCKQMLFLNNCTNNRPFVKNSN